MHLLTSVHGSEYAHSQYGILDVDRSLAQQVLTWRTLAHQCKTAHPQFYRLTFWGSPVRWYGADAWTRIPAAAAAPSHDAQDVDDVLTSLIGEEAFTQVTDGPVIQIPDGCTLPESLLDQTEYDTADITEDGIRFKSYLRHADDQQETELIPWHWFEQIAADAALPS